MLGAFLLTWQTIVPVAVTERINMTQSANGNLEASAQERVDLWEQSKQMFFSSPIVGTGYATFQLGEHVDNLKDTHNWYVKVLVETGIIGGVLAVILLGQMLASRLFTCSGRARIRCIGGWGLALFLRSVPASSRTVLATRWTYLEINGLLWVLTGATVRARRLLNWLPRPKEMPWTRCCRFHRTLAWR